MTRREQQAAERRTEDDRLAVEYIQSSVADRGYPPSRREMAEVLGFKSVSGADSVLNRMVREGIIEIDPHVPRGIRVVKMVAVTEEM